MREGRQGLLLWASCAKVRVSECRSNMYRYANAPWLEKGGLAGDEARAADERSMDGDRGLRHGHGHGEKPGSEPSENEPLMPNYCETSG